jgi:hypothetical protein
LEHKAFTRDTYITELNELLVLGNEHDRTALHGDDDRVIGKRFRSSLPKAQENVESNQPGRTVLACERHEGGLLVLACSSFEPFPQKEEDQRGISQTRETKN